MNKYRYIIGIDTGVNTGIGVWDRSIRKMIVVDTMCIHQAMEKVHEYHKQEKCFVRVEDARERKWFGKSGHEQLQGAGSIKRDAKIWEDFLKDKKIDFEMVAPKNNKTKMDAKKFAMITGWKGRTSNHARDAAWLCFGF